MCFYVCQSVCMCVYACVCVCLYVCAGVHVCTCVRNRNIYRQYTNKSFSIFQIQPELNLSTNFSFNTKLCSKTKPLYIITSALCGFYGPSTMGLKYMFAEASLQVGKLLLLHHNYSIPKPDRQHLIQIFKVESLSHPQLPKIQDLLETSSPLFNNKIYIP